MRGYGGATTPRTSSTATAVPRCATLSHRGSHRPPPRSLCPQHGTDRQVPPPPNVPVTLQGRGTARPPSVRTAVPGAVCRDGRSSDTSSPPPPRGARGRSAPSPPPSPPPTPRAVPAAAPMGTASIRSWGHRAVPPPRGRAGRRDPRSPPRSAPAHGGHRIRRCSARQGRVVTRAQISSRPHEETAAAPPGGDTFLPPHPRGCPERWIKSRTLAPPPPHRTDAPGLPKVGGRGRGGRAGQVLLQAGGGNE